MNYVILAIVLLALLSGIVIIYKPELFCSHFRNNIDALSLHVTAVVGRATVGAVLIFYAGQTKFPLGMEALGWVAVSVAVMLCLIGRANFKRLMRWALSLGPAYERFGGVIAVLFGGFIAYAVL